MGLERVEPEELTGLDRILAPRIAAIYQLYMRSMGDGQPASTEAVACSRAHVSALLTQAHVAAVVAGVNV